jgi:Ca-activated chloride channel homolog
LSGRSRVPLVLAAVVGVLAVLGVRVLTGAGDEGGDSAAPVRDDSGCVVLQVAASSEKAALLRDLAADYVDDDGEAGGTCARVEVTSKASGGAMEALGRGWDDALDGPRPDVWSPASTSWTALLRQRTTARDAADLVPDGELPSIAQTPLVIAMPRPMAETLGWPDAPLGWSDVLTLSQDPQGWGSYGKPWGAFKLGKTHPGFSTSGLHATVGAYVAATGLSSDLSEADLADPEVQEYVRGVENAAVHYGDTTLTFLSNLQRADQAGQGLSYVSAVTVEEKSVWDYNQGNPSGDPQTLGDAAPPRAPLVAVYPQEGTLVSDNPWVVLQADWVDDGKRAVAEDFLAYVQDDAAQERFAQAGFRGFDGTVGPLITPEEGLLPQQPAITLQPPSPPVLDAVQASWEQLRKRARILLVLDVSGSMGEYVGSADQTRLDLAKQAASEAVTRVAPDDEIALWIFSTDLDGSRPYRELVSFGPAAQQLGQVRSQIDALVAQGGTGLYATTRAAARQMKESFDPSRINAVVVLTDGKNEYAPDSDIDSLTAALGSEDADRQVRVFPIAYGEDADIAELRKIAEASRAAVYDASDPASIDKVLTAVLSNF